MNTRKAKITDEHLEEARRLRQIWDSTSHESQAEFGEKYNIGNQSSVGQFLNGKVPLSIKAAHGFATGLRCSIADFSPRLSRYSLAVDAFQQVDMQASPSRHENHLLPVVGRDSSGNLPEQIWGDRPYPEQATGEFVQFTLGPPFSFALEVLGLSMSPRYQPGEYVVVEPRQPVDIEDDVLVRLTSGKVLLRKLASPPGASTVLLSAYNDASVLTFQKEEISWIYRISHAVPGRLVVRL